MVGASPERKLPSHQTLRARVAARAHTIQSFVYTSEDIERKAEATAAAKQITRYTP